MVEIVLEWSDGMYIPFEATGAWVGHEANVFIERAAWDAYLKHCEESGRFHDIFLALERKRDGE